MPVAARLVSFRAAMLALTLIGAAAAAATINSLSPTEASHGLRAALSQGISTAVAQLGKPNGFLNDPKVAIPLPPALDKAERGLRLLGMQGQAEELKATRNHAAEQAVAKAEPIFKTALEHMSVEDAKSILTGGDDAATQYFRRATSAPLSASFKPVVSEQMRKLKVAALYDQYAGKAAELGLVSEHDAHLDDYVTGKALDGLYSRIADEERLIRKDPLGQANSLIKTVFGALGH
jgi:hypothetical protein